MCITSSNHGRKTFTIRAILLSFDLKPDFSSLSLQFWKIYIQFCALHHSVVSKLITKFHQQLKILLDDECTHIQIVYNKDQKSLSLNEQFHQHSCFFSSCQWSPHSWSVSTLLTFLLPHFPQAEANLVLPSRCQIYPFIWRGECSKKLDSFTRKICS